MEDNKYDRFFEKAMTVDEAERIYCDMMFRIYPEGRKEKDALHLAMMKRVKYLLLVEKEHLQGYLT